MPRPEIPPLTRGVALRGFGFAVAVALGAVAVWLIVTSTTQKRLELGVLAGLWGLLIGAFCLFGSRRGAVDDPHASAASDVWERAGSGLELRSRATQVERAEDVAARRAHEARIEQLLREEIRAAVNREVGTLRAEIAQLRTELLEKVGGQLRLEHIETTRVIGSDLEALQDEIRALKTVSRDPGLASVHSLGRTHLVAAEHPVRPAPLADPGRADGRGGRIVEVEASADREPPAEAEAPSIAAPRATSVQGGPVRLAERPDPSETAPTGRAATPGLRAPTGRTDQPSASPLPRPEPSPPVAPVSEPAAARSSAQGPGPTRPAQPEQDEPVAAAHSPGGAPSVAHTGDVFAGLPRLSRFVDDAAAGAPSADAEAGADGEAGAGTASRPRAGALAQQARGEGPATEPADPPTYQGRRRRSNDVNPVTGRAPVAGHAPSAAHARWGQVPAAGTSAADRPVGSGQPPTPGEARTAGAGRRHRADDQPDDLLARVLAREKH